MCNDIEAVVKDGAFLLKLTSVVTDHSVRWGIKPHEDDTK